MLLQTEPRRLINGPCGAGHCLSTGCKQALHVPWHPVVQPLPGSLTGERASRDPRAEQGPHATFGCSGRNRRHHTTGICWLVPGTGWALHLLQVGLLTMGCTGTGLYLWPTAGNSGTPQVLNPTEATASSAGLHSAISRGKATTVLWHLRFQASHSPSRTEDQANVR